MTVGPFGSVATRSVVAALVGLWLAPSVHASDPQKSGFGMMQVPRDPTKPDEENLWLKRRDEESTDYRSITPDQIKGEPRLKPSPQGVSSLRSSANSDTDKSVEYRQPVRYMPLKGFSSDQLPPSGRARRNSKDFVKGLRIQEGTNEDSETNEGSEMDTDGGELLRPRGSSFESFGGGGKLGPSYIADMEGSLADSFNSYTSGGRPRGGSRDSRDPHGLAASGLSQETHVSGYTGGLTDSQISAVTDMMYTGAGMPSQIDRGVSESEYSDFAGENPNADFGMVQTDLKRALTTLENTEDIVLTLALIASAYRSLEDANAVWSVPLDAASAAASDPEFADAALNIFPAALRNIGLFINPQKGRMIEAKLAVSEEEPEYVADAIKREMFPELSGEVLHELGWTSADMEIEALQTHSFSMQNFKSRMIQIVRKFNGADQSVPAIAAVLLAHLEDAATVYRRKRDLAQTLPRVAVIQTVAIMRRIKSDEETPDRFGGLLYYVIQLFANPSLYYDTITEELIPLILEGARNGYAATNGELTGPLREIMGPSFSLNKDQAWPPEEFFSSDYTIFTDLLNKMNYDEASGRLGTLAFSDEDDPEIETVALYLAAFIEDEASEDTAELKRYAVAQLLGGYYRHLTAELTQRFDEYQTEQSEEAYVAPSNSMFGAFANFFGGTK